jgi:hypothetical protein
MAFMRGATIDLAAARNLGLSVRETTPAAAAAGLAAEPGMQVQLVAEDHVFIGTAKGEVLACDASRQGLLVLRVPVLK